MGSPRLRTKYFPLLLLILMPALVWVLGSGGIATAGYADSAHGDETNGVERSGCQDSQEPPQPCPTGSCAHCHDTFDSDICTGTSGGPPQLFVLSLIQKSAPPVAKPESPMRTLLNAGGNWLEP